MPAHDMPPAEAALDAELVHLLLADQHPDLADLPILELAQGWDNAVFRLGDELVVRLPRRELSAALVHHEQKWLPRLAPSLPVPIPVPIRVGQPGLGYPWGWSVCAWFSGHTPINGHLDDPEGVARSLGGFVAALHQPAPAGAPVNPYRGIRLRNRTAALIEHVDRLGDSIDAPAVLRCWDELVATPPWDGPPLWLHGDLHPANIVVEGNRLAAVIDFGDLCSGDPATDLAIAWMLFEPPTRAVFRGATSHVDDSTWARARGWSLVLSVTMLANSADNPPFEELGRRTLAAVLDDGQSTVQVAPDEMSERRSPGP